MYETQRAYYDGLTDLIRQFVDGELTADEFHDAFLKEFKKDPGKFKGLPGRRFKILDTMFACVDDFISDPKLLDHVRQNTPPEEFSSVGADGLRVYAEEALEDIEKLNREESER
jgi:hypothetical protein